MAHDTTNEVKTIVRTTKVVTCYQKASGAIGIRNSSYNEITTRK